MFPFQGVMKHCSVIGTSKYIRSENGMLVQRGNGKLGYFECKIKSAKRSVFPFSMGLQHIHLHFSAPTNNFERACSWAPYLPYEPPNENDRTHRSHPVSWGDSPRNRWIDESPTVSVGDRIGLLVDCSNDPTFSLVVNGVAMQTYLMGEECLGHTIYPDINSNPSGCDFEVIEEPEMPERSTSIYEPQLWGWRYPGVARRPQDP